MNSPSKVLIHGDEWQRDHIVEEVAWCREQIGWQKELWRKRPAVIDKHHKSPFRGSGKDPHGRPVDPTGWTHDHCLICWWTIHESENPEEGTGYTYDGRNWLCCECYGQFISGDKLALGG